MDKKSYQEHQAALQQTVQECMQVLQKDPASIPALGKMGDAYLQLHQHGAAIDSYRKILSVDDRNVPAMLGIATACVLTSKHNEAIETAQRALEYSPGNIRALGIIAAVLERKREVDSIIELLKAELDSGNTNPVLVLPYARALEKKNSEKEAITLLEATLSHPENGGDYLISTYFLLGKLYDKLSDYDTAFSHFEKANALRYIYMDPSRPTLEQEHIRRRFTSDFMAAHKNTGISTDRPVFIVGMPRSGTTLVDRIISSHPDAVSAGELVALPQLVETMCPALGMGNGHFTTCIEKAANEQINALASEYLRILENERGDASRITDKMPVNFMYLGVIQMLFPDARVINCIRNPADLCLSCYIQDFHGFKPYLNSLEEIAMVYRNYKILMEHWKSVLSLKIHDVEYETLVTDPETEIPRLIDFIGLTWNEKCLDFHKEGQFINTVSYDQVDRPMYHSSISRWKNYEKYLGPLRETLGEHWPEAGQPDR